MLSIVKLYMCLFNIIQFLPEMRSTIDTMICLIGYPKSTIVDHHIHHLPFEIVITTSSDDQESLPSFTSRTPPRNHGEK
jgi:hypothetical protein